MHPLQFCDLLSDGYARGGVDALLSLKGTLAVVKYRKAVSIADESLEPLSLYLLGLSLKGKLAVVT